MNRSDFIPVSKYTPTSFSAELPALDFLNADYLSLSTVRTSSTFVVTQDTAAHPDLISYNHYGSTDYWWVICMFNSIVNPLVDLYVGKVLQIPDLVEVSLRLQAKNVEQTGTTFITVE